MNHARTTKKLAHGRLAIALHALAPGRDGSEAPPLLLLHELGSSTAQWRAALPDWEGGIHGLDLPGHGESDRVRGGGYNAEHMLAAADIALAELGDRAAVAGAGIGAWVALLLAGSRPEAVPAALLFPGEGLAGAGSTPDFEQLGVVPLEVWEDRISRDAAGYPSATDPMVSIAGHDFRPDGYAASFADAARCLLLADAGAAVDRLPGWWRVAGRAARSEIAPSDVAAAFARLAARAR